MTKSIEPSTADASTDGQNNATGSNGGMMGNNPMMMNGMGQMPYGFQNQAGFNNGMYGMNGMPNMMANGNWNGMNSMGRSLHQTNEIPGLTLSRLQQHERHAQWHIQQLRWKHGHGHERHVSHELRWRL